LTSKIDIPIKKPRPVFYGWFIVATGVVAYTLGYGARYSFSVIFPSLLEEFRWPRDVTAAILSVQMLFYGLVAPVTGSLVDRVGPRKTMSLGITLLAMGLALSGRASKPWHFYLSFGILTGTGLSLTTAVPFTIVLKNWFERKRGLAFSLLSLGTGGAFACSPAIALLVNSLTWRTTFVVEAIIVAGIMLPLVTLIVRYHPQEKGFFCDGTLETMETSSSAVAETAQIANHTWTSINWTLAKAVKTGRLWLLCLSAFSLWGIVQHMMVTHHIAFAVDMGYSKIYASSVISLFGLMFVCGSMFGAISDQIGRELVVTIGTTIGISSLVVLTLIKDTSQAWMLYYYAMAFSFSLGVIHPTLIATVTDIFQGRKAGTIIGFVWFIFAVGGFIGPWLGGWIFEFSKSYVPAFIVAMVMYVVGCAAIWLASPRKIRPVRGHVKLKRKSYYAI
jgi:MFS family permease